VIALSAATTLVLAGCNDGYEERSVPANASPITDMLSAVGEALSFSLDQQARLGVVTVGGNGGFYYRY